MQAQRIQAFPRTQTDRSSSDHYSTKRSYNTIHACSLRYHLGGPRFIHVVTQARRSSHTICIFIPGLTSNAASSFPPCTTRILRGAAFASAVTVSDVRPGEGPHEKLTPSPPRSRALRMEPLFHCAGSAGRMLTVKTSESEAESGVWTRPFWEQSQWVLGRRETECGLGGTYEERGGVAEVRVDLEDGVSGGRVLAE